MTDMVRKAPVPGKSNQLLVQEFRSAAHRVLSGSVLTGRSAIASKMGVTFGGKRDIYEALGYPKMGALTYTNFYAQYLRGDIAARLIDAPVNGAWEQKPIISEDNGAKEKTTFEKDWETLIKDHKIWNVLNRFDRLSRIGQYGVLLFGFDDTTDKNDLREEVQNDAKLMYLQPYGEGSCVITDWETDPTNPRYGFPKRYRLTIQEPTTAGRGSSEATRQIEVHADRVLHTAEILLESNVFGIPALMQVYNRLLNLELIVGGSAEMFWQGAFPGYAFIADAETDMAGTADDLKAEIDLFVHDLKRYMKLQGLKVEKLSPEVADPTNHVDVQLTVISIATGIPKRILMGSERGELASGQDESHWNDKLHSRRTDYLEPMILRPFIDKLIQVKALPEPSEEYSVTWPDLNAPTDKDKADVGKVLSSAIREYLSSPEAALAMPFEVYLKEILLFEQSRVDRIINAGGDDIDEIIRRDREAFETERAQKIETSGMTRGNVPVGGEA